MATLIPKKDIKSSRYLVAKRIDSSWFINSPLSSPLFGVLIGGGNAGDIGFGFFIGRFGRAGGVLRGVLGFGRGVGWGGDNLGFLSLFEFLENGFVGEIIDIELILIKDVFLL